VRRSCLDASDALRRLGWQPRTALDEGLALTLDYARSYEAAA
jgi:nucleoside-diphosphate-sugar epimerase